MQPARGVATTAHAVVHVYGVTTTTTTTATVAKRRISTTTSACHRAASCVAPAVEVRQRQRVIATSDCSALLPRCLPHGRIEARGKQGSSRLQMRSRKTRFSSPLQKCMRRCVRREHKKWRPQRRLGEQHIAAAPALLPLVLDLRVFDTHGPAPR